MIYFKKFNLFWLLWFSFTSPFIIFWIQREYDNLGMIMPLSIRIMFAVGYLGYVITYVFGWKRRDEEAKE